MVGNPSKLVVIDVLGGNVVEGTIARQPDPSVDISGKRFRLLHEDGDWKDIPDEFIQVEKDLHWQCERCGWCCNQDWQIELTWREYDRLRGVLSVDTVIRDETTGREYPCYVIRNGCEGHIAETRTCGIYDSRPFICRSFPFYLYPPFELYVSRQCRGVGRGPVIDIEALKRRIFDERVRAGMSVDAYSAAEGHPF